MTTGRINQIATPMDRVAAHRWAARGGELGLNTGRLSRGSRKDALHLADTSRCIAPAKQGRSYRSPNRTSSRPGLHRTVKSVRALAVTDIAPLDLTTVELHAGDARVSQPGSRFVVFLNCPLTYIDIGIYRLFLH